MEKNTSDKQQSEQVEKEEKNVFHAEREQEQNNGNANPFKLIRDTYAKHD